MIRTVLTIVSLLVGCTTARPTTESTTTDPTTTPTKNPTTHPTPAFVAAPFEDEIRAFETADRSANPPPKHAVVFYGSSSFRIWKTMAGDLAPTPVVNRGFGGSRVPDCIRYVDRVVVPLEPRMVVLYAGDNDLAEGASAETVIANTHELLRLLAAKCPRAHLVYVTVKPSPSRARLLPQGAEVNGRVREMIDGLNAAGRRATFVDVATPMLGPDGRPRPELFGPDRLHMNATGYTLWTSILKPIVAAVR